MPKKQAQSAAPKEPSKFVRPRRTITKKVSVPSVSSRKNARDRAAKSSTRMFSTTIWKDGIVNAHKKRIAEYQTVKATYDAIESDLHKIGRRWDKVLASIRIPFKSSPIHKVEVIPETLPYIDQEEAQSVDPTTTGANTNTEFFRNFGNMPMDASRINNL